MPILQEADIQQAVQDLTIPPCPAILSALAREMRQPEVNAARIAHLIRQDVGLAAGVMKCANSPLFGSNRRVGSINEALTLLGFRNVLNLVANELLHKSLAHQGASMERFWDSATYCAGVCAKLAEILPGTTREAAYTFGLFHDCGIPLLMKRYPDYKATLGEANACAERPFTSVEDQHHHSNHAVIGYLLARTWGLADSVCRAILCHHDYEIFEDGSGVDDEACVLVAFNLVTERVVGAHLRVDEGQEWDKGKDAAAAFLGLSATDLDDITDDLLYKLDATLVGRQ